MPQYQLKFFKNSSMQPSKSTRLFREAVCQSSAETGLALLSVPLYQAKFKHNSIETPLSEITRLFREAIRYSNAETGFKLTAHHLSLDGKQLVLLGETHHASWHEAICFEEMIDLFDGFLFETLNFAVTKKVIEDAINTVLKIHPDFTKLETAMRYEILSASLKKNVHTLSNFHERNHPAPTAFCRAMMYGQAIANSNNHIACLDDDYLPPGMTPEKYRELFDLESEYRMLAKEYLKVPQNSNSHFFWSYVTSLYSLWQSQRYTSKWVAIEDLILNMDVRDLHYAKKAVELLENDTVHRAVIVTGSAHVAGIRKILVEKYGFSDEGTLDPTLTQDAAMPSPVVIHRI